MGKRLGIVCTGGEGPEPETLKRLVDECVPAPLLAAADSGLLLAEAAGLKPDWIIGDMDSLDAPDGAPSIDGAERLRAYPADRVIRYPVDKDLTDTELALALLWEKGCDEVWIIGGGGGRLDHLLGIRDLFERERFPRRWITADEDIHCVADEDIHCISITPHRRTVSVFPIGGGHRTEGSWKARSVGLKWPLDNVHWERGLYGLSNAAVGVTPEITINAEQGRFLIILEGLWQRV